MCCVASRMCAKCRGMLTCPTPNPPHNPNGANQNTHDFFPEAKISIFYPKPMMIWIPGHSTRVFIYSIRKLSTYTFIYICFIDSFCITSRYHTRKTETFNNALVITSHFPSTNAVNLLRHSTPVPHIRDFCVLVLHQEVHSNRNG